ncbi:MAG: stage II sporulation protein M [Dermatophilaceae bacterium]
MDLDAFVLVHQHEWARLEQLASRRGTLSGAEGDELLDLYQRVATHLSEVRSTTPEPAVVAYLSSLLARARSRSAGTRTVSWSDAARFVVATFPAALYRTRRWWLTTMAVSVVGAVLLGWWFYVNPQLESSLASPQQIEALVNHEFEDYYSQYAAGSFAVKVWTNNAWIAALCIAFGVFGLPVVLLVWDNLANLAIVGALMWRYDRAPLFFGLILPHGLLELTAVFVAAGVGLRIFWAWVEPGPRTRLAAVAQQGRAAMSVALGLVGVLLVSGVIEAFVTPSRLPTWARILVGLLAEAAFLTYVFTLGRYAALRGHTGDVSVRDQGETAPTVA